MRFHTVIMLCFTMSAVRESCWLKKGRRDTRCTRSNKWLFLFAVVKLMLQNFDRCLQEATRRRLQAERFSEEDLKSVAAAVIARHVCVCVCVCVCV